MLLSATVYLADLPMGFQAKIVRRTASVVYYSKRVIN
jgi:hypothetical protein